MNEVIIGVVVGIVVGLGLAYLYLAYRIKDMIAELESHLDQVAESIMVPAVVEKENGIYYCYQESDHKFLAQGASLAELREIFKTTMPEKTVYISGGNAEAVAELKQEVASADKLN